jgi:hypothetical protein
MPALNSSQLNNVKTGQKFVIYAILLNLVTLFFQFLSRQEGMQPVLLLAIPIALGALGLSLFGMYRLTAGLGYELGWRILFCVFMVIPCVGLIVLLVMNSKATNILRAHGFKVGLLGAKKRDTH